MLSAIFKRLGAVFAAVLFGAWSMFLAVLDWFGRMTAGRDALVAAGIPEALLVVPWWWTGALAAVLTALLVWLNWPRPPQAIPVIGAAVPQHELAQPSREAVRVPSAELRYLAAAIVTSGFDKQYPEYRARFDRSGSGALFAVEYSAHMGSALAGGGWMPPRKINVHYLDRFTRGQIVIFSLIRPSMTDNGMYWFFGDITGVDDRFTSQIIAGGLHIRGRVTLHIGDVEEHCYFIMDTTEGPHAMPEVTGEHMFEHMYLWEGKDPPNGDSKTLFSSP